MSRKGSKSTCSKRPAYNKRAFCKNQDCRKPISRLEHEKYNGLCMICGFKEGLSMQRLPTIEIVTNTNNTTTNNKNNECEDDIVMIQNLIKKMQVKIEDSSKDLNIIKNEINKVKARVGELICSGRMKEYDKEKKNLQEMEIKVIKLEERINFSKEIILQYDIVK